MAVIGVIIGILYIIIVGTNDYIVTPARTKKMYEHLRITKELFENFRMYVSGTFSESLIPYIMRTRKVNEKEATKMYEYYCDEITRQILWNLNDYYEKYGCDAFVDAMTKRKRGLMYKCMNDTEFYTEKPDPDFDVEKIIKEFMMAKEYDRMFQYDDLEYLRLKYIFCLSDDDNDYKIPYDEYIDNLIDINIERKEQGIDKENFKIGSENGKFNIEKIEILDIYIAEIDSDDIANGKRPVLITSNNLFNKNSCSVNILPFTTHNNNDMATKIKIKSSEKNGLNKDSWLLTNNPYTINSKNLINKIGHLEEKDVIRTVKAMAIQHPFLIRLSDYNMKENYNYKKAIGEE